MNGHPFLWYIIIAPFAKLGFPYATTNIISWAIMQIAALIILKRAPFNKFLKIVILFSAPFIYYYPVISRSYCLIPLELSIIAMTYKNKKQKPIQYCVSIAFLANTHILMIGLVLILYLELFWEEIIMTLNKKTKEEKKKILFSALISFLGLLILFLQLYGSIDQNIAIMKKDDINGVVIIKNIYYSIINLIYVIFGMSQNILMIIIVVLIYIIYNINNINKKTIMLLITLLFQIIIYSCIYKSYDYQKNSTALLIILFFSWIQIDEKNIEIKKKNWINLFMLIIFTFNIKLGVSNFYFDYKYEYSNAKEVAKYINENISEKSVFIPSNIPYSTAIIPYLNKEEYFWNMQNEECFTFCTWNESAQEIYDIEIIREKINKNFQFKDNIYFIYCYNWKDDKLQEYLNKVNCKEVFKSEKDSLLSGEKYIIYKLY